MRSSKRVVRNILVGAVVAAMGVTTLFANAGSSYAAGEAKLNKTSRNILTRQSYDFDVTGAPSDAVITWKSSDDTVAAVDENGVVTGIKKGTATITCEVTSAGKTQTLTAEVQIRKPAVKIEINNKVTELEYGNKVDLNRTLTPKSSNDVTTWKSSDASIAKVDANGVVTALKDGTVTITATTMSGKSDSVEITVFGAPKPTATPKPTAAPGVTTKPENPAEPTAKPTATPKPQSSKVIYEESFEKSTGSFEKRGSSTLAVKKSAASPDGMQYLMVSGRTSNWHGAAISVNKLLELGGTYKLTAQVRQNDLDSEVIKATLQKNSNQYSQIQTVTAAKGEWVELTGEFTVDADTTDLLLYFEADGATTDFMIDAVKITQISKGTQLINAPVAVGEGKYDFKTLKKSAGYANTTTVNADNSVTIAFTGDSQYRQQNFAFPDVVKTSEYSKVIINMTAPDVTLGLKIYEATGASSYDAVATSYVNGTGAPADFTIDLTGNYALTDFGFMTTTTGDITVKVHSITVVK
ncbi:MAG: carbohydrate binding domain-containing protein [Lachnospiraceae bacterium]